MDLYLYMTEDYQEIENDKLKEEVFFQVKNFYVTNDLNSIDKDIDYFKFKEEDIKSVKNIDLMYDIFEYNYNLSEEICRLIRDTEENKDKLKFFEENLKEKVIFDNSIDDLNDSISIITFKDEIVAYNLDKRCKRDFSDYIYFKDEETFKNLIQNYVDCFNDKLNIDDLDLSNIQYMSTVMFKDIIKIITKEEYLEKKVVKENLDLNF